MTNLVYQTTVEELEAVLSPRVVSRSLQEGLKQIGKTPADVIVSDIEKILKAYIYRQLQVAMPVNQAKDKINTILERLADLGSEEAEEEAEAAPEQSSAFTAQTVSLEELRAALKPFNLYFEWPETQKLRAQIGLIETELEAGREAPQLVSAAQAQLTTLQQKLEDQLVAQADELSKLEASLEGVESLGGAKVRRLESLINQIREAQGRRQLAPAEVERARKIATDLRKLMQSSVIPEETEGAASPPPSGDNGLLEVDSGDDLLLSLDFDLPDEVSDRIMLLDVESERHELDTISADFSNLLAYRPELAAELQGYRDSLAQDTSLGETLLTLRERFAEAQTAYRATLTQELSTMQAAVATMDPAIDTAELRVALQVNLGVLSATLPPEADIKPLRDLYRLAERRAAEQTELAAQERAQAEAKLRAQGEAVGQLKRSLERYRELKIKGNYTAGLEAALAELEAAQEAGQVAPETLAAARAAAERLENLIAERAKAGIEKQRAQVRNLLAQVQALPLIGTVESQARAVQTELEQQLADLALNTIDETHIQAAAGLVDKLKGDLKAAYRKQISNLVERASALADRDSLTRIQEASEALENAQYPDLSALERSLKLAFEARRAEQVAELHGLESEARALRGGPTEERKQLEEILGNARSSVEQGLLAEHLDRAWMLLERLRELLMQRTTSFEPRLDKALEAFEPVSRLNTDETAQVKRILQHLDAQREAFHKVSAGMQEQLVVSLDEAETMLQGLQKEFEATRDIAGKLVSANILDDILGIFGNSPKAPAAAPEASPAAEAKAEAATTTEIRSNNQLLNGWLDDYLSEWGVRSAVIFSPKGSILGGRLDVDPKELVSRLRALSNDFDTLGAELSLGHLQLMTIETPEDIMIASWPAADYRLAVILNNPAVLSLVLNKLRRDLPAIADILSGPAFA